MTEYIEREKLQEALKLKKSTITTQRYTDGWNDCMLRVKSMVHSAPTADAVEVCYCKDCKHMEIAMGELLWCNAWNAINGMGDYGYCNYGERKGGQVPL